MLIDAGPHDQRSVQGLPDYGLIYCSEALPEDLTIAGEVCVTFPCSRTAPTPILSPSSSTVPLVVYIVGRGQQYSRVPVALCRRPRSAGLSQCSSEWHRHCAKRRHHEKSLCAEVAIELA